jgi:hypothetical protein
MPISNVAAHDRGKQHPGKDDRSRGNDEPRQPIGDIAALFKKMIPAATRLSGTVEQIETRLRDWPVAVLSLLIVTVMLGVALMAGH